MIEPETAITPHNILNKMCFMQFGAGLSENGNAFRVKLQDFLKRSGTTNVTRQAIHYWFENNSAPRRASTFEFMLNYMEANINYEELTADRKKVFGQINRFLRRNISGINKNSTAIAKDKISTSRKNQISINLEIDENAIRDLVAKFTGIYLTYRVRLVENRVKPVAREVLRVFQRHKELRFEHWYLRDGSDLSKYEGVVTVIDDTMWFFGATNNKPERLRIMNFRNTSSQAKKYNKLKWGIMLSNIPVPSLRDPAACRIVLLRVERDVDNLTKFIADNVGFITPEEVYGKSSDFIWRMIDNTQSAVSEHESATPIYGGNRKNADSILKVNNLTLDNVFDTIFPL